LVAWLVSDRLLLRDFGPCVVIFMNVCFITVSMIISLRDFGPCKIILKNVCYKRCHGNAFEEFWALCGNTNL
jgi:hypothetical protein